MGDAVGQSVGDEVGRSVGSSVGENVGELVGFDVGNFVGLDEGIKVGDPLGKLVGTTGMRQENKKSILTNVRRGSRKEVILYRDFGQDSGPNSKF